MKKASQWIGAVIGLAILFPVSAVAAPSHWTSVRKDASGEWFINKSSIARDGSRRTFWSYIAFSKPSKFNGQKVYSQGDYISVDCATQKYGVQYKRYMDQNNQLVKEINYGTSSILVPARSKGEMAGVKFVCSQKG